ncbi:TRAP transporter small permease [Rhizobium sp. CCGE 510]|uniref:TRAP transporter small permease n=1 Tax=Rhizobium sp. CCGE 510 TaxID=1132836 RepID=UPI00027B892A|nr:TRAP transporter small permease [Rhizobium sp. CCGE 510]EJT01992.1 tripartite AtP-independent periplasmic transporter subunit DctQ [Rhizobium sp. CCGE 510]
MLIKYSSLTRILELLCATILVAIILMIFANVVGRYFFHAPLHWSDELAQYLFLWLSYLGALAALMKGRHYSVTLLIDLLPKPMAIAVKALSHIVVIVIFAILIWYGWKMVNILQFQKTPALRMSVYYFYIALPVTSALMLLVVVKQLFDTLRGRPSPGAEENDGYLDERP